MAFIDERKEYEICGMFPKRPWMNYLWNEEYIAIINQFGCGKGRMSAENNFQRDIVKDTDSRLLYIKADGEITALNRNYKNAEFDTFKTIVGIGYSTVISEYKGIRCEFTIIVPHKGKRECWRVVLKNTSAEAKEFDLYAFAEIDARIGEHLSCTYGDFDKKLNGVYFRHKAYDNPTEYHVVHFATSGNVAAYETAKRRFIGTYGNILEPDGIKNDKLSCTDNSFDADTQAILQSKIKLAPGEEKTIYYTAGVEKSIEEAETNSKAVLSEESFNEELRILAEQTSKYDDKIYIDTPDEEINRLVNIWLKRQMDLGKTWGRVYNKGFRDIMQDISGFVQLDPQICRSKILDCAQYQKEDGNTLRSWVPIDRRNYRDGATWLLQTVTAYIKETADKSILDEKAGYFESDVIETLFEHCIRAIEFLYREVGEHGLCLWGGGDWNDSFDGAGLQMIGESVWLSIAAIKSTNDFNELLSWLGKDNLIKKYTEKRDVMTENIHKYGWNEDHFIYGINDWHERVGSYDTPAGRLFLNPQTWAVLAHIADDDQKLMDLVEDELSCDFGYVQQKPCYTTPDPHVGRISYFGKGFYENGSVYNHGVAFKIVADCVANRGDNAYKTIKMMLATNPKNSDSGVEPYALCNMYFGPENETRKGEAPMHWITGTSSWMFRGIVEYLIGVRADFDGLLIDPRLPDGWDNVKITRAFRNAVYSIEIKRGNEKAIVVDGKAIDKNVIPVFDDGKKHEVLMYI